jgi:hypothetical protein
MNEAPSQPDPLLKGIILKESTSYRAAHVGPWTAMP